MFMDWARLIRLGNDEAAYRHFSALFKILPEKIIAGYTLTTLPSTDMNIWTEELDTIHMHQRETKGMCVTIKHTVWAPCLGQINDKKEQLYTTELSNSTALSQEKSGVVGWCEGAG